MDTEGPINDIPGRSLAKGSRRYVLWLGPSFSVPSLAKPGRHGIPSLYQLVLFPSVLAPVVAAVWPRWRSTGRLTLQRRCCYSLATQGSYCCRFFLSASRKVLPSLRRVAKSTAANPSPWPPSLRAKRKKTGRTPETKNPGRRGRGGAFFSPFSLTMLPMNARQIIKATPGCTRSNERRPGMCKCLPGRLNHLHSSLTVFAGGLPKFGFGGVRLLAFGRLPGSFAPLPASSRLRIF